MFPWIETLHGAAAVHTAGQMGVFEGRGPEMHPVLRSVLTGVGVLDDTGHIASDFEAAWLGHSVDIMARAGFYRRVAADVASGFEDIYGNLDAFMQKSATFRLFDYDQAMGVTREHIGATKEWVGYLEALSRVETPLLVPHLPFLAGDRLLEVGGNSGVLSQALTEQGVDATIMDLPAVCAIGRERHPDVTFVAADAREPKSYAAFAGRVDSVLFKSVLHDWPEPEAREMLKNAALTLPNRGQIVVCERGVFDAASVSNVNAMQTLANLVFSPFYRAPDFYVECLGALGFEVSIEVVEIDMPFNIITGRKL